jgi:hypothetical protein
MLISGLALLVSGSVWVWPPAGVLTGGTILVVFSLLYDNGAPS